MNTKWTRQMIKASLLLAGIGCLYMGTGKAATAAETPTYTLKKGKYAVIHNIIRKNPLTQEKYSTYQGLKWKSGNKKIVKIIKNKKIKALKKGKVYIRGYNSKKKRVLSIRITVGKPVSKLSASAIALYPGQKANASVKVSPASAANKKLFYHSSDDRIATVTKTGSITACGKGNAVITVTSKDGRAKKKIKVSVQSQVTRTTSKGNVKGIEDSQTGSLIWYGIPYGASTAGINRWKAPQPVTAWNGTMDATIVKQRAAQYGDGTAYVGTEDCLYVNIYHPNNGARNLPVMVYLHGGGNASGTSNVNFTKMAIASNCIVVSVEYRVGAFGYLSHKALQTGTAVENSGNYTLLDIKAALTWVRDEIANFDGNPSNVTLSGFSAGARNAMLCMISPEMKGLFHKAILFSGGCNTCTNEAGQESVEGKLASILVKRGTYPDKSSAMEYLEMAPDSVIRDLFYDLSTAEVANMYQSSALRLGNFPQGFNDGTVIPKEGFAVISSGNYNRVPVILASDASEFSSFATAANITSDLNAAGITTTSQITSVLENGIRYGSMLQSAHYVERTAELFEKDTAHLPVYAFRFKWGLDASVTDDYYSRFIGAYHGVSKDFLRGVYKNSDTVNSPNAMSEANKAGRLSLTQQMQSYIGNFMSTGNPNGILLPEWGTWSSAVGSQKIMIFDANATTAISAMSSEHYDSMSIFEQMRDSLTQTEYEILTKALFKGRFFMPEVVPEY